MLCGADVITPHATIDRLAAARPDFISVTYGANGSSRGSSLEVLRYILRTTTVDPMAHLTCVGSSHAQASQLIREFLAWSFVREDQPLGDTARQVALALRDEIADLEAAGIGIVQVDEPALRELLPLKKPGGLKTRGYRETVTSLQNLQEATRLVRSRPEVQPV